MVRGQSGRAVVLGVLAALVVALAAGSAGADSFSWKSGNDQNQNSNWDKKQNWDKTGTSKRNWPDDYSDQATINVSDRNPVLIGEGVEIKLGGQISTELPYALYIGSDAGATALRISGKSDQPAILGMKGNIYVATGKTIEILEYGSLRNDSPSGSFTDYSISGGGSLSLQGGTIGTLYGGGWIFNQAVTGYGTISAPVVNNATVTFSNDSTISNTFSNNSGGSLNVTGGTTTISGNFTNQGTVSAASGTTVTVTGTAIKLGSFTSSGGTQSFGTLKVEQYGYLVGGTGTFTVSGDFLNYSTQNNSWNTTQATLAFVSPTGSGTHSHTLALAGLDYGQVPYGETNPGYSNNYAWGTLSIETGGSLSLTGNSGAALYVGVISGLVFDDNGKIANISGDFNIYYDPLLNPDLGYKTFAFKSGTGKLLSAVAPVPLPESVWLMGGGLLGLVLLGRRWRRRI